MDGHVFSENLILTTLHEGTVDGELKEEGKRVGKIKQADQLFF